MLGLKRNYTEGHISNMRYNPETDMVEIFYNGIWNVWKPATIQALVLYNNGDENIEVTQGWDLLYGNGGTFTKNYNEMVFYRTADYQSVIAMTKAAFDVTPYTKVSIEFYTSSATGTTATVGSIYFNDVFSVDGYDLVLKTHGGTGVLTQTYDISSVNGLMHVGVDTEKINCNLCIKSIKLHN